MSPGPALVVQNDSVSLAAALDAAVVCDLSPLAVLAIDGPDATTFLNGQLSSDISSLTSDVCQYTSYNSPGGRMLANMVLWRAGRDAADGFRALLSADLAESVRKRLAMFVLRSKVTITDVTATTARYGIGGPAAGDVLRAALGIVPSTFAAARRDAVVALGVPGPRYLVMAPADRGVAIFETLTRSARSAGYDTWRWLTIHAGVPVITAPTQDKFVPQTVNWDVLGGINFQKGCYTGQEIIARTQYLGRLKERLYAFAAGITTVAPGDRLFSREFGEQPCGTVVNAAPAPRGGSELLAVVQIAAAANADVHLGAPDGPVLTLLPLPYPVPVGATPRARTAGMNSG
jgi:folate-binding protein YgfZ